MKHVVVDTNVAVVANARDTGASPSCIEACCRRLQSITQGKVRLTVDDGGFVFDAYRAHLRLAGQPGVGDLFMRWVHTNRYNPSVCASATISPLAHGEWRAFAEVPADDDLRSFDRDDHVFVAVSVASPSRPPVLNAVDSDWWDYQHVLARHGVKIDNVCPDQIETWERTRPRQAGRTRKRRRTP